MKKKKGVSRIVSALRKPKCTVQNIFDVDDIGRIVNLIQDNAKHTKGIVVIQVFDDGDFGLYHNGTTNALLNWYLDMAKFYTFGLLGEDDASQK